jgi:hypothetical protein
MGVSGVGKPLIHAYLLSRDMARRGGTQRWISLTLVVLVAASFLAVPGMRSEERRVGKEC